MRKYLIICAMTLAACACNRFRTDVYTFDELLVSRPDSLSSLSMSISVEYPVKGLPTEVLDSMGATIMTAAFDLDKPSGTVEEAAARYISYVKEAYLDEEPEKNPYSVEDEVNGYFSGAYGKYRTYMIEYYTYTGGAHGLNTYTPLVFDCESGRLVREEDFFVEGYSEGVSQLLQKQMTERPEEDQVELFDLFSVAVNGAYEPGKDGVTWYFQPYEIAPYAYGVITVTVPWSELQPWLR